MFNSLIDIVSRQFEIVWWVWYMFLLWNNGIFVNMYKHSNMQKKADKDRKIWKYPYSQRDGYDTPTQFHLDTIRNRMVSFIYENWMCCNKKFPWLLFKNEHRKLGTWLLFYKTGFNLWNTDSNTDTRLRIQRGHRHIDIDNNLRKNGIIQCNHMGRCPDTIHIRHCDTPNPKSNFTGFNIQPLRKLILKR